MIVDHLSRIEKLLEDKRGTKIEENFLDEQLFQVTVQVPWYADLMSYFTYGNMPPEFTFQQKMKLKTYAIFYIWDDPLLFRSGGRSNYQEMCTDSCHSRVIWSQQYLYPKFPLTTVVKLMQYSGLRSNTEMGFLCTNDLSEVKNGAFRALITPPTDTVLFP